MDHKKRIRKLSLAAAIVFLIYNILMLLFCIKPDIIMLIPYFDYLEEYYDGEYWFIHSLDEDIIDFGGIFIPSFLNIMLFTSALLRVKKNRSISKKKGTAGLIISIILLVSEYISLLLLYEHYYYLNELLGNCLMILILMFMIPVIGEIILALSFAYEIIFSEISETKTFGGKK